MPPHLAVLLLQTTPPATLPEWILHHAPILSLSVACLMPFVLWALNRRTAQLDKERAAKEQAAKDSATSERAALDERLTEMEQAIGQFVDKDALERRFGEIEGRAKLMAAEQMNQHNTLHEYERKRTELSGEFRANINQLQEKVHALETMPGRVGALETKLDNLTAQITDLKTGQRDLRNELREDMRGNKSEILTAIRDWKPSKP